MLVGIGWREMIPLIIILGDVGAAWKPATHSSASKGTDVGMSRAWGHLMPGGRGHHHGSFQYHLWGLAVASVGSVILQ